jgi:hypothetical protein
MKYIPLTKGQQAIVDDADFTSLNRFKWHVTYYGYAVRDARRPDGRKYKIWMHRVVNQTPDGMDTDHINMNKRDNRRTNLRTCTRSENFFNRVKRSDNTSGFKGVAWHTQRHRWVATIKANGRRISLGLYDRPEDAAAVYRRAAKQQHGNFARS